ncbi:MAG TPA: hypothetical protein VN915_13170 [Elusimicrobiota bacterium]|nr:hypothetical protein [Elusimicrobiota bacterium]
MNNTIAVEPNTSTGDFGVPRIALTAAFVFLGLVLLFFARHHIRRHHKTRHHHRY